MSKTFPKPFLAKPLSTSRGALHENVSDINNKQKSNFEKSTRHVDPNDPQYRISQIMYHQPFLPPAGYDSTLQTNDIEKAQPSKFGYSNSLHKIPETRDNLVVNDINHPDFILKKPEIGPRKQNFLYDVRDINLKPVSKLSVKEQGPLQPVYDWKRAEIADFSDPHKNQLQKRDYIKNGDLSLRSNDLIGIQEDKQRRAKNCGLTTLEHGSITNVKDINAKRPLHSAYLQGRDLELERSKFEKDVDKAPITGFEQPDIKVKRPSSLASSGIDKGNYDFFKEMSNGVYKQVQAIKTTGPLDIPNYIPPPPSEVLENHYHERHDPKLGVLHETIGELPGPGKEVYAAKLETSYKHQSYDEFAFMIKGKQDAKAIAALAGDQNQEKLNPYQLGGSQRISNSGLTASFASRQKPTNSFAMNPNSARNSMNGSGRAMNQSLQPVIMRTSARPKTELEQDIEMIRNLV